MAGIYYTWSEKLILTINECNEWNQIRSQQQCLLFAYLMSSPGVSSSAL